jgi:hypothetical protein
MADKFRKHSSILCNDSVYANDEYILIVGRSAAAESYRRLHHRDIQSLQIVIQPIRKVRLILPAIVFLILFLMVLGFWSEGEFAVATVFLLIGTCIGVISVHELITLGRRCQVFVTTAVQKARLPGVTKVAHATRFIDTITPLITAAQGTLSPEELQVELDKDRQKRQARRTENGKPRPASHRTPPPPPPHTQHQDSEPDQDPVSESAASQPEPDQAKLQLDATGPGEETVASGEVDGTRE